MADWFSFFDEDANEKKASRLLVAHAALSARAERGAVELTVPFLPFPGRDSREADGEPRIGVLRVELCGPDVMRVSLSFDGCALYRESEMLVGGSPSQADGLTLEQTEDGWTAVDVEGIVRLRAGCLKPADEVWSNLLSGPPSFLTLELFPDGRTAVPLQSADLFVPDKANSVPLGVIERDGQLYRSLFSFEAQPGERFHGTGERFAPLNLAGRTVRLVNQDALGVNNRKAYKNVPFYLSSRPYGIFIHSSAHMALSLADVSSQAVQGAVDQAGLDLFVIGGGSMKRVLQNYRDLTGVPPQLPLWTYGIWMSRMTYFSAAEVQGICRRLREEGYPCDVIHLDTGWFDKDWVCEWEFGRERFPDPAGMMRCLREDGFRVSLWQTINVSSRCKWLPELLEKGYIPDSEQAHQVSASDVSADHAAGQIDFTHPGATAWYQERLRHLLELGTACIKTDFGEEIHEQSEFAAMPGRRLHNLYALLYQKAAFEVTQETTCEGIIWARAGWAGCQRYPVHWGGDAASTWDGLAASLKGGLHLGLSGFAYWSHDTGGFHGVPDFMNSRPDPHLYLRWVQFAVFCSHMRFHGTSPREPWHFPEVADEVRRWMRLRYALIPYLVREAENSRRDGGALLRPMLLEFEHDPVCGQLDDQFLCGCDLLVAPVLSESGSRLVYLPGAEWVDLWSGQIVSGPVMMDTKSPLSQIPVYVRRGSVIPFNPAAVSCTGQLSSSEEVLLHFGTKTECEESAQIIRQFMVAG